MDFSANKQDTYEKRIASLPDQPNMQPDELKAYFDSSPEEVRQAYNGLCDTLGSAEAASGIGFQRTAAVPADTVQAAVENVQAQLDAAVMGNIPSGSVTGDKLAQDVRNRFSAIESAATTEASTRASADTNLQNQINTHTSQIASLNAAKCEIYTGTYIGNGAATRDIVLGFRPKAVFIMQDGFLLETLHNSGQKNSLGGLGIDGWTNTGIVLTNTGIQDQNNYSPADPTGMDSMQLNVNNYNYVYLAFK